MYALSIKPIVVLFTLLTGFSVLLHDTHVDKASVAAITVPTAMVSYGIANTVEIKTNDPHIHTEKVTGNLRHLLTSQPKLQSRFTDEKKYLNPKKASLHSTAGDDMYSFA